MMATPQSAEDHFLAGDYLAASSAFLELLETEPKSVQYLCRLAA
jgi:hypothetical protein